MRRVALAALSTAVYALWAAPAYAPDHHTVVNEVMLSKGTGAAQFVEIVDPSDEIFPELSYKLVVYDGAGNRLGAHSFALGLGVRDNSIPMLISTAAADSALGTQGDERLNVPLPVSAGQVCFTRGLADEVVHCLRYGSVASPVTSNVPPLDDTSSATPPDGLSAQRQATGSAVTACPTPKAANATRAGTCAAVGSGVDTAAPIQRLGGRRRQDVDRAAITVRVNEAATVSLAGVVKAGRSSFRLRSARRSVGAGVRIKVRLRLRSKAALRAVKRAIAQGRRSSARVTVTARDRAGNKSTARKRVRLRD